MTLRNIIINDNDDRRTHTYASITVAFDTRKQVQRMCVYVYLALKSRLVNTHHTRITSSISR